MVISHLDYANSILAGLSSLSIKIIQKSKNTATRLILGKSAKESTTDCLKTLHWLPIQQRIDYKIYTLIHKCNKGKTSSYLQNLMQEKKKPSQLYIGKQERCSGHPAPTKVHFCQQTIQCLWSKPMELIP